MYGPFDADGRYVPDELVAGDRLGPPPRRRRGKLWAMVVLLAACGGAWGLLGNPTTWSSLTLPRWLTAETASLAAALDRKLPGSVDRPALTIPVPTADAAPAMKPVIEASPPMIPPAVSKAPIAPDASSKASAPTIISALPPATAGADAPPGERLPPPTVDPADPLQTRAEAVGLHPGLSRVLLTRLSSADYKNAGIAIQKAVAETPDSDVLVWPRQRKPELALFQVRFVPGAAPDCRRYVVTVTKDGWVTTALPMERCGPQVARSGHQ